MKHPPTVEMPASKSGLVTHQFDSATATGVELRPSSAIRRACLYGLQSTTPNRLAWYETADYVPPFETLEWTRGVQGAIPMSFRLHRSAQNPAETQYDCPWLYVVHTDIPDDVSAEYNAWYDEEHLPRLVQVPGVVRARRYAASGQAPRYLTAYDLTDRDAFSSPDGLKARNTPWTTRMRSVFRNTRRFTGVLLQTM